MSGKEKQNTIKTTAFSDGQGRTLFSGVVRPGRMHDQTAVRTEGIAEQFRQHPEVKAKVDEGYRGLANEFPDQVDAPPKKPKDDAPLGEHHAWREQREAAGVRSSQAMAQGGSGRRGRAMRCVRHSHSFSAQLMTRPGPRPRLRHTSPDRDA
ncbi:transposase family protein [Streptomyces sp. NPDC091412]|uniref:transposase family protein n=1 Tax=Streptomyces sp. NPDC091412 TaxID=3366002 RepID=UPI00380A42B0